MKIKMYQKNEFDRIRNSSLSSADKWKLYSFMCRYNTIVSVKKAGSGHLGSSFSAMDIVVYLYLFKLNITKDNLKDENRNIYFSSKGHDVPGLYSVLYSLGILSLKEVLGLRKLEGLDGHPDINTPGIESNTGSLGMGISKARGMAKAKRLKKNGGKVFVLTGDGELQEGQIYESLQTTAHQKINEITAIADFNKYQTDRSVASITDLRDVTSKIESFGWHVINCNGHDFNSLDHAFTEAAKIDNKPVFIVADTIKGYGVSFMEPNDADTDNYKWHSGAPDDVSFESAIHELEEKVNYLATSYGIDSPQLSEVGLIDKSISGVSKEFVAQAYGEELCALAETRQDIVVLDGDLAADCKVRDFETRFPDRFIENGIAEQDMVSMAGGLALMGLLPVVNSFASFLSSRANEQIYNNACEHTKIIYANHFAGLIPAGPGKSHQSLRDISVIGAISNVVIMQPCNAMEAKQFTRYCVNETMNTCVLRLNIGPSPRIIELPESYKITRGKGIVLREGYDATIISYGPVLLHESLLASEYLSEHGIGLEVINMPWLNYIDAGWINELVSRHKKIYILDDHMQFGGLGHSLLATLAKNDLLKDISVTNLSIDTLPACGTPGEVLAYHKLSGAYLAKRIWPAFEHSSLLEQEVAYSADAPQ